MAGCPLTEGLSRSVEAWDHGSVQLIKVKDPIHNKGGVSQGDPRKTTVQHVSQTLEMVEVRPSTRVTSPLGVKLRTTHMQCLPPLRVMAPTELTHYPPAVAIWTTTQTTGQHVPPGPVTPTIYANATFHMYL